MRFMEVIVLSLGVALATVSARAQGTFQDLDFESATLTAGPPSFVPVSSALPGWTAYIGTVEQTQVQQNAYNTGQAVIDIFGPNYPAAGMPPFSPGVIDGNYSVLLQAGLLSDGITPENVSIAQTGTVPVGSQYLEFDAWLDLPSAQFTVSFDGVNLSPVTLGTGPNYSILYGANIAPYAGQTGTLAFTAVVPSLSTSWIGLDDITFSATPEPSPLVLTGIGGVLFAIYRRFATERQ
ncbi:MAG: PEP-CTERM sorting domain-containing protein [Verrucomicrobiota bacterium]|jgi:hypothetical protein